MDEVASRLAGGARAIWVEVARTEGSAPREEGAGMAVFADAAFGSVGGGQLEYQALAQARHQLTAGQQPVDTTQRHPLGPALGQCCGGVVYLRYRSLDGPTWAHLQVLAQPAAVPVALFGGGHIGRALVQVLAPLPFAVTWIDSRDGIFPADLPTNGSTQVVCEHSQPVQAAVTHLAPGSRVLVMSFSHAEDLDIIAACLKRQRERADLPFVGLIGSRSKWAVFRSRLQARGFSEVELQAVHCPVGLPGIRGKQPAVIAVAIAAQLLQDGG